ncbi:hypothetical protein [Priestia endophytica]|uniref:hypothetical protein n=1 Tax=Priestia endophytica TaxID=135735 RepID=UPI00227E8591|nr:hypothetical protein [Priestia endophytica]MCY8235119.1 hypothetical protein [Priestia endophytica]
MVKGKNTSIKVTRDKDKLTLKASETTSFDKVTFNLKDNRVTTKYGTLPYDGILEASEQQVTTGPWSGHAYKLQEGEADISNVDENTNYKSVRLYVGQLRVRILHYI